MHIVRLLALCGLAFPWSAAAQSTVGSKDIEDRESDLEEQKDKLETSVFFETEWHEFDNLDFRKLDESSDQAILDSDDRGGFAFTGVSLELGYKPDPNTRLVVGTSYRGLWGGDQIGNASRFGGFFYFTSLFVEWTPHNWAYSPTFRVGRMRQDIGGIGGAREFILGDIVDQVRIDFPLGKIGTLITIPINVVGLSQENDDVTFVSFIGQSQTQIFGFRGDRMSRRHGAILAINPEAVPQLDVRGYAFYTDLGALGSGSDISYGGRLGNFYDNDWVLNWGVRASYGLLDGMLRPFATFDGSNGIDRKEFVTNDVNTNGFAWSAGLAFRKDKDAPKSWGFGGELSYFEAMGPAYLDNGQLFSHGYVGMKARQVGGLLANRFLGWHPSAYVGAFGVSDSQHDTDRKSGTRVVTLNGELHTPSPVSISLGYWFMQDTGTSDLIANSVDIDTLTPPFGYSREEYRAQARLGKVLGHEIDAGVGVRLSKHLSLYAQGAVLLPGAFYGIEIGRVAGDQLGSSDPQLFWDAGGGARMRF